MRRILPIVIICIFLISCRNNEADSSTVKKAESKAKKSTWIDVTPSDLKRISWEDSLEAFDEIKKHGFISVNEYVFISPLDSAGANQLALGDFVALGKNSLIKLDRDIWYVFPINRLSYYKQYILNDNKFSFSKQEVKFNDRYNKYYIAEYYYPDYGSSSYRLQYYDSFGMICLQADRMQPVSTK